MFRPTMTSTEPGVPTAAIANGPYRHPRPPRCPHILSGRPPFGSGDRRVGAAALIPALPDTTGWLALRQTQPPDAFTTQGQRIVRAETRLDQTPHWDFDCVRGGTAPKSQCVLAGVFALEGRS